MMSYSKEQIIAQYVGSCKIIKDCTLNGDYKRNNAEGAKIIKIFKYLERNITLAREVLPTFFKSDNVVLQSEAAAQCISLGILCEQAISVLERIANDNSNSIFSFNAEMTLKVYREQGYLIRYPKQTKNC